MAKKMPGRLVALSASAVATIYLAGLVSTQPAAQQVAAAALAPAETAVVAPVAPSLASSVVLAPAAVATATSATTQTGASSTTSGAYANGTYSGTGTSRFGTVSVSVTIAGGSISNVQVTRVTTSYPASRIASLPAQVVQQQSASVNAVTGATYSSQAFKQAVQQALAQAQAANTA